MPILKGREGEFRAIEQLSGARSLPLLPIFEVPPSGGGPTKDAYAFSQRAQRWVPQGLRIGVDLQYLADPSSGNRTPVNDIAEDLDGWGIPIVPVLHLTDSPQRLADLGRAAERHGGRAIVRLGSATSDPDDGEAGTRLGRLQEHAGLTTEQCDLLLDMFEVRSERDVTRAEPVVRKCVSWAQRHSWRSVTVAAGGMPTSISALPTNTPVPIRRWDAALFDRVRELGIHFGDYGIAHPQMTTGGRPPMPNLRYTGDGFWWIYRWPRESSGNASFFDLCANLVGSDHWPDEGREHCWGDAQLALRAVGAKGPGTAMNWRAWATSHHLAFVLRELDR